MFLNHIKIALRQLRKQKFYSLINIFGLAIGVACCMLIALFVRDELSYDKQHPKTENLYRVYFDFKYNDRAGKSGAVPPILAPTLLAEISEITNVARINPHFFNAGENIVRKENQKEGFYEKGFVYADPELFDLFDLPILFGDKNTMLNEPFSIVLTEQMAEKYFPNEDPIGKILILNDNKEESYRVTAVMKDMVAQNHIQYDFFMSINTLEETRGTNWIWNNYYTYLSLADGVHPDQLTEKLREFAFKNFGPQYKAELNADLREMEKIGQGFKLKLQPVSDIHLYSQEITQPYEQQGDIAQVRLFSAIAFFILLIALVNFVNLSTAKSANRAKEVGLRKVLGSYQKQLIAQFLTESVLMSFLAFALGTIFAVMLIPTFNELSGKTLNIPFTNISFLPIVAGTSILIGVLAGLYPSFYLSSFQPVKVLKGKLSMGSKNSLLRSSLVVFQFAISIGLTIGTTIVFQQMSYIQNKNLGFQKGQVLLIQDTDNIGEQVSAFKNAMEELPEGKSSSMSSFLPLDGGRRNQVAFYPEGIWKRFASAAPFRYDFLDDRFSKMYKSEDRVMTIFSIFSILAIFIACLGLLALATFMTEQRMKEIGIRKVLGASILNIVFTRTKKFIFYVLIGLCIATPIAWLQMNKWLDDFAYRIDVEWWVFLFSGILATGTAPITVGLQSLKTALMNPVESIRGE
jgi:putative ABC transport system permease protein